MSVAAISAQSPFWQPQTASATGVAGQSTAAIPGSTTTTSTPSTGTKTDTATQAREVSELQTTDQQVRAHEAAHLAAAGSLASGGAQFTYETGPDGERYAVGGEVSISVSEGRTPQETLQRADQIRRAALAPADPSGQDLAVAAMASQMAAKARQQIAAEQVAAYSASGTENGNLVDTSA